MFNSGDDDFRLTDLESWLGLKSLAMIGLYLLLAIVVLVTGTHAVMLVLSQAPASEGGGLVATVLDLIRISFPVTMELAAVVAGIGFVAAKWRKRQKWAAFGIEMVWVVFAAANMVTFFRVERGLELESWQEGWISYGLPLSALIAGVLVYMLSRTDPDLKRKEEETAAGEKIAMIQFGARRDVAISAQRIAIERQKAWIDFVKGLRSDGYTDAQIRYMLQDTPDLLIDDDKNGQMDLLEDESVRPERPSLPAPAPVIEHDIATPALPHGAPKDASWMRIGDEWKLVRPIVPLSGGEVLALRNNSNGQGNPK